MKAIRKSERTARYLNKNMLHCQNQRF